MLHYIHQLVAHFVFALVPDMLHVKRAFYNMYLILSCRFHSQLIIYSNPVTGPTLQTTMLYVRSTVISG